MAEAIRIVLIDDHPLFREGVAYTLADTPGVGWFNGLNMVLTVIVALPGPSA